jgi:hypothetical protein
VSVRRNLVRRVAQRRVGVNMQAGQGAIVQPGRVGVARPGGRGLGGVQGRVVGQPQTGLGRQPNPARSFQPVASPPGAAAPPAGGAFPPQAGGQPFQFTPDAQFLAQLAQAQFQRQQQINQLDAEADTDKADTAEAIRRLLARVEGDRGGITAGANKSGLLYSGHLAKSLDDYQSNVTQQQGDMTVNAQRRAQARAAARAAIEQGQPLDEAAFRAEAVERQIQRDQDAAQGNMLAANPPQPAPAGSAAAARPAQPKRPAQPRAVASRPQQRRRRRGRAGGATAVIPGAISGVVR